MDELTLYRGKTPLLTLRLSPENNLIWEASRSDPLDEVSSLTLIRDAGGIPAMFRRALFALGWLSGAVEGPDREIIDDITEQLAAMWKRRSE